MAWADFDVYVPERWADDLPRRRAAGIPDNLRFATKPDLATGQLERLMAAGLPTGWAAMDEVYGRSGKLRKACEDAGLAHVAIIPCDYQVTVMTGTAVRADRPPRARSSNGGRAAPGPRGRGSATGR